MSRLYFKTCYHIPDKNYVSYQQPSILYSEYHWYIQNNLYVNLTACPARHVPIAPLALCVVIPVLRLVRITSLLWRFVTGCGRRLLGGGEDTGAPASRTHANLPEEQECREKKSSRLLPKKKLQHTNRSLSQKEYVNEYN